jgi:hypothetical protein
MESCRGYWDDHEYYVLRLQPLVKPNKQPGIFSRLFNRLF